ncbi:hypothetical protein [Streptomyces catenulae]|uniref:Lipoprotein n=1 Tax=Streptomyces catenulae TaxID=66875 RepID=A0ABV2Z6R2_9ACTN|nr:hypothetical protein [Streptomyces catenulae]
MNARTNAHTPRRRTLRVALAALTVAAGLTLTACSGADAAATKPAGQTASAESGGAGSAAGAKAGSGAGADHTTETRSGSEATRSGGASATDEAGAPDKTVTLVDGSKAEIHDLGNQNFRAKIVHGSEVLATLKTANSDAAVDLNGMYVLLTMGGEVHSWEGGAQRGPGTFTLAGGWQAKVTKIGELHFRAEIIGHEGSVDATLEANEHAAGVDANGVSIVLTAGGEISAHE